ncbi:biotin carboxylase N-terminal domain-containing protein [Curvibacter sp. RS43]|uniref:acetyl/propionyl/methylcrotonyl-CoA carboxylase subunit alpha n=1 Tax=Curvibacter microcysteis TaxID=3026419 RepID=UPI002360914A|nr:biotin carboxylase N-terminal domain-containing protein [Curvibacter sp. RS43]MDD0812159.1 biotin carboxylase N-terminal domain-containing protein [Curvibacter sp. RS43]
MKRLLIANRGEIARRIIRSAHALGLETVAVFSEPDAEALHVREAGQAFALGGSRSADSYLRVDRLLAAARATGADAVHPGYGFLSENADFAQAVLDAGLAWVGPPPHAIQALGSKAAAKVLAQSQGVPCLPGYAGEDQRPERFATEAERIGYPVMVKAVAGGGGRGMRLVTQPAELAAALASARSEALAGFGCGDLLIERALLAPRHVELQVFADTLGHCIHLGERDCSVQRRHQKIIEEAPSPAVDAALRQRMGDCAVALARAAGYVGAGTVEFLLDGSDFYLMEMNTRLQVEHPVTEALTGLDLVEWQLRVARGEPLPLRQEQVRFEGHAIELRLCAEDEHFRPHTGRLLHFSEPPGTRHFERAGLGGLRFDHALATGTEVSPHYDPLLGKLIAHGPTREAAIEHLLRALAQTELLGLPSNRAFLAACLDHPEFRAGQALIPFVQQHGPALRAGLLAAEQQALASVGPALGWLARAPAAQLACTLERPLRLRHRDQVQSWSVGEAGQGVLQGRDPQGQPFQLGLQPLADGRLLLSLDGRQWSVRAVALAGRRWHVQLAGVDGWLEDASFEPLRRAGEGEAARVLRAPFNGRVLRVDVAPGQALLAGQPLLVIESMKLEHVIAASAPAQVAELLVAPGQQVAPGQVLLRLAPAQPAAAPVLESVA